MGRKETSDTALPGFQPIDPWSSEDLVITHRNLPHLEVPGATYFVTFRCRSRLVLAPETRDLAMAAIQGYDGESIELDAAVVMPDHAHAVFRLVRRCKLSQVVRAIKGRSARQINRTLKRAGAVWLDESFDHIVRDEAELEDKIEYIRQNPVKDGLAARPEDYRWLFVRKSTA